MLRLGVWPPKCNRMFSKFALEVEDNEAGSESDPSAAEFTQIDEMVSRQSSRHSSRPI